MPKRKILQEDQSYTFQSYFEMPYEPDEILAEFGYSLIRDRLALPQTTRPLEKLPDLRQRIDAILPYVSLTRALLNRGMNL